MTRDVQSGYIDPMSRHCEVLSAILLAAGPAAAARVAGADLNVERSEGARDCPDEVALGRAVEQSVEHPLSGALAVHVALDRSGNSYTARIRVTGTRSGVRNLRVAGPDCSGLADALAVTLALLLDPDAKLAAAEGTDQPPVDTRESSDADEPRSADDRRTRAQRPAATPSDDPTLRSDPSWAGEPEPGIITQGDLALGPAVVLGLLPEAAGGLQAAARLTIALWAIELGGTWLATQALPFQQGRSSNQAGFLQAGACALAPFGDGWSAGGCAQAAIARLHVQGHDFDTNRTAIESLWLAGAGVRLLGPLAGPLGWELRTDVLIPLGERSFSVDNLGLVWGTASVTGGASLGLTASLW